MESHAQDRSSNSEGVEVKKILNYRSLSLSLKTVAVIPYTPDWNNCIINLIFRQNFFPDS